MRAVFLLCLACGCGIVSGPDAPIVATLKARELGAPADTPSLALVWYGPGASVTGSIESPRFDLNGLEVDVDTLPPETALVSADGARRYALGQLVYFDDNDGDGAATFGTMGLSPDVVAGVPMPELLLYLEGPPVESATPVLPAGAPRGFSWLVPSACAGVAITEPLSTSVGLDFGAHLDPRFLCTLADPALLVPASCTELHVTSTSTLPSGTARCLDAARWVSTTCDEPTTCTSPCTETLVILDGTQAPTGWPCP